MKKQPEAKSKRTFGPWIIGGLFAAVAVLGGLTLRGLRSPSETPSSSSTATGQQRAASGGASARPDLDGKSTEEEEGRVVGKLPEEIPPWKATPENTGPLPPGTVPAWKVNPPPPDPNAPPPPTPVEPPNPATHRPSMF